MRFIWFLALRELKHAKANKEWQKGDKKVSDSNVFQRNYNRAVC
jgi:hypothetical protein